MILAGRGPFGRPLGGLLGRLGGLLGRLGPMLGVLERSLGVSGVFWGRLGSLLELSWPSWSLRDSGTATRETPGKPGKAQERPRAPKSARAGWGPAP